MQDAHEVAHAYHTLPTGHMPKLATSATLSSSAYRGLWRFPCVVGFSVGGGDVPHSDGLSYTPFKQVAKVAKVANRRVRMETPTTYGVASSGGDLATPEEVATAFPCVRCSAPAGPSALLCPACYAEKRPPKCPACGGRLVAGKCGWC